jgi:F-type H+-transporting ATPase subunit alpha
MNNFNVTASLIPLKPLGDSALSGGPLEVLPEDISAFGTPERRANVFGRVRRVRDGIIVVGGIDGAMIGELAIVKDGEDYVKGMVLNLDLGEVGIILLEGSVGIRELSPVWVTGRLATVPVGEAYLSRVVDPLGNVLDGSSASGAMDGLRSEVVAERPLGYLEAPAPGIIERQSVFEPLHTGIVAIDAMIPIGRGQRELIIGDRQVGKTSLALDVMVSQLREGSLNNTSEEKGDSPLEVLVNKSRGKTVAVYAAIGQKLSSIALVWKRFSEEGERCDNPCWIVVAASASIPAATQYIAPYSATAMAEYFMRRGEGESVVVVYDDLTKHANAYREISLLLRRPPGREAFPGDIFYVHSRLLERSAKLFEGGSITGLPVVETQEGDVSAYIPTNVISITDGQVYLSEELFNSGVRPAIDVGISVSRVGSAAQTGAMKSVTGRMKLVLAQLAELESFAQFASDLDDRTVFKLAAFRRVRELLKQGEGEPVRIGLQVILLRVALLGGFQFVGVREVSAFGDLLIEVSKGYLMALGLREGSRGTTSTFFYPWELGGENDGKLSALGENLIARFYLQALARYLQELVKFAPLGCFISYRQDLIGSNKLKYSLFSVLSEGF